MDFINYSSFFRNAQKIPEDCIAAIKRILPHIKAEMPNIQEMITDIPDEALSRTGKEFLCKVLPLRAELLLERPMERLNLMGEINELEKQYSKAKEHEREISRPKQPSNERDSVSKADSVSMDAPARKNNAPSPRKPHKTRYDRGLVR